MAVGRHGIGSDSSGPDENPWPHVTEYVEFVSRSGQQILFACKRCFPKDTQIKVHVSRLNNLKQHVRRVHKSQYVQIEEIIKAGSNRGKTKRRTHSSRTKTTGLRILAFPCNQFGNEEPGSSDDIAEFALCKNIKFDIYETVDVNGETTSDLWNYLKHVVSDKDRRGKKNNLIKWSYNKFIVTKGGVPVERYGAEVEPLALVKYLENYW